MIISNSLFLSPRVWDHQLEFNILEDVLRVICYSNNNTAIVSNSGLLMELDLSVNASPDYYLMELENIILNGLDGDNDSPLIHFHVSSTSASDAPNHMNGQLPMELR